MGLLAAGQAQVAKRANMLVDILPAMRRWIAILLMIVLPLQLSWAVAANYCQDEQGVGVQHFGHHAHLNHDVVDAGENLAKAPQQADSDCGCAGQLCGAHFLPAAPEGLAGVLPSQQVSTAVSCAYPPSDPPRIERPNWPVSR